MLTLDPMALARRQIAIDRTRTRRFAETAERKVVRMRASPLAFLRGAAPLFYELVQAQPELAGGPPDQGWLVGDLHIENFGAFAAEVRGAEKAAVVFDVNDFDDCMIGPVRLDVLRLATSLILAGRELGATGGQALEMVGALVDAWSAHLAPGRALPKAPRPVRALLEQVRVRGRADFLDARSRIVRGRRRLVRGERYGELPAAIEKALPAAFARYVESLPEADRPAPEHLQIVDAAFRIAGTGSLGALRIAVLVNGKGGRDGGWIFDLKEQGPPSGAALGRVPDGRPAERVLAAMRACLARAPRLVGTTELRGLSMLGRRLAPQEDRLDLTRIAAADLPALARSLGALVGGVHRRGAAPSGNRAPRSWTGAERAALAERAIGLASIHEGAYLAYCALTR